MVEFLLDEAGVDKIRLIIRRADPLRLAAKRGHSEVVKLLLKAGADKDVASILLLRKAILKLFGSCLGRF